MLGVKPYLVRKLPPSLLMHLSAADHYLNGEDEIRLLSRLVPRKRPAIDAGANIGTYSYFLRKYASRVHAYEPNPDLAGRLGRLMPDLRVRNVALSDSRGTLVLKVPVDEHGRFRHELGSVAPCFDVETTKDFSVDAVTIDDEALEDVGFIKVDVEQHERQVLRGGLATIRRCRPVLLVELYPLRYARSLPEEVDFLTSAGYCPWFKFAGRWFPIADFRQDEHARRENWGHEGRFVGNNVIFLPAEHQLAKVGPLGKR